ncbi:hypothetical protein DGWBC_1502 [Dehalogenimonas sp. WBC-2]|nr:hypothetical protein DGWBC_1502 [Dehalogenimonas sp. WBC-2]
MIKRKAGFTLVEVLIALTITGLIMGGITTAIIQLISVSNQNTNSITAQRQVQQVGEALSHDVLQARTVTIGQGNTPPGTGFRIVLTWTDISGNRFVITYRLESNGIIYRDEAKNGGVATTRKICENISTAAADTHFGLKSGVPGTYSLMITASISGKINVSETRTYEMKTRAFT